MPESSGPELLRAARADRGRTQQQLADAAGLSVRAVRALETGRVARPRSDTSTRLVDALGLTGAERTDLLAAWGLSEPRRVLAPEEMLVAPERHAALLEEVRRRQEQTDVRLIHDTVTIRQRRIAVKVLRRLVVARTDDVTGTALAWIWDNPEARRLLRITDPTGCRLVGLTAIDERTTVLELSFGRTLARGEAHFARLTRSYSGPIPGPARSPDNPWRDHSSMTAAHRGVEVLIQEVSFDPAELPRRCVYLWLQRMGGTYEQVRDVPVAADGRAVLSVVDPVAGWHSIGWEW